MRRLLLSPLLLPLIGLLAPAPTRAQDAPGIDSAAGAASAPGIWTGALGFPGTWSSKGELGFEGRLFKDDHLDITADRGAGLLGRLEIRHSHARLEEKLRFFGRLDHYDRERTVLVFEEAWLQAASERVRLRAGMDLLNWTATEAFHPADVINARNLDSDLENLEKVGELMAALQVKVADDTSLSVLYMPYRTQPILTSPNSRLSFAPGIDLRGSRRMLDRDGRPTDATFGHQAAVALRQVWGSADFTVHALEHMDRLQPLVRLDPAAGPFLLFQTVRQVGGTYQQALGPLIVKLEGAYRRFVPVDGTLPGVGFGGPDPDNRGQPDHGIVALGLEYGVPHAGGSESTLLLEGQALLGVADELQRANLSVFQRDVLGGYRFALNDETGKELLLGAIFDLERAGEMLLNASYQQRLGDTWTVRAGLRIFHAKAGGIGPLAALRDADHLRFTLTRHF